MKEVPNEVPSLKYSFLTLEDYHFGAHLKSEMHFKSLCEGDISFTL
jgi:hypothetical protein